MSHCESLTDLLCATYSMCSKTNNYVQNKHLCSKNRFGRNSAYTWATELSFGVSRSVWWDLSDETVKSSIRMRCSWSNLEVWGPFREFRGAEPPENGGGAGGIGVGTSSPTLLVEVQLCREQSKVLIPWICLLTLFGKSPNVIAAVENISFFFFAGSNGGGVHDWHKGKRKRQARSLPPICKVAAGSSRPTTEGSSITYRNMHAWSTREPSYNRISLIARFTDMFH